MSGQILFFWSANLVQVLFAVRMRKSIGQINQEWKFLSEKVQIPFCRFRTEWATQELNQISPIQHATKIWTANKSWGKDGSFLLLCAKGEDSESWVFLILFQFISFLSRKTKTKPSNISALPLRLLQKEILWVYLVREGSIFHSKQREQVEISSFSHNSGFTDCTINTTTSCSMLHVQLLLSSWAQIYLFMSQSTQG